MDAAAKRLPVIFNSAAGFCSFGTARVIRLTTSWWVNSDERAPNDAHLHRNPTLTHLAHGIMAYRPDDAAADSQDRLWCSKWSKKAVATQATAVTFASKLRRWLPKLRVG
ncbi:MAG: hypothetical protein WDZ83_20795 [Rhizobiaceae bacterium]